MSSQCSNKTAAQMLADAIPDDDDDILAVPLPLTRLPHEAHALRDYAARLFFRGKPYTDELHQIWLDHTRHAAPR